MKKIFKILLVSLISINLQACFLRSKPSYDLIYSYDQNAPEVWKLGWQHGCESGYSTYGSNYFSTIYTFKQDVTKINDQMYYKGWNDAFNVCRSYVNRWQGGDDKKRKDPAIFSPDGLNITASGLRADQPIFKTGLLSGTSNEGFFGGAFNLNTPGYGDTKWGSNVDECDWLGRCGDDIPKDPMDALLGH